MRAAFIGSIAIFVLLFGCREDGRARGGRGAPAAAEGAQRAHLPESEPPPRLAPPRRNKRNRWRDCGVYVDGAPVGMLKMGELPEGLTPIIVEQTRRLPFRAGEKPRHQSIRVPRYRFVDYLQRLGVSVDRVREVHIHGGRGYVAVIDGDKLRAHPEQALFRFGGDTYGKPLPELGGALQVNTNFDNMAAVAVYLDREPPQLTEDERVVVDGQSVEGVPYFGEPLRGGIRVYVDGRLFALLKRNQIEGRTGPRKRRHGLAAILAARGLDIDRVDRIDRAYDEVRHEWSGPTPLSAVEISFDPDAHGSVRLEPGGQRANAIFLATASDRPGRAVGLAQTSTTRSASLPASASRVAR